MALSGFNMTQALDDRMKSGDPPIVVDFLEELPMSEYWHSTLSDTRNTVVWKLDKTTDKGKDWYIGVWLNSDTIFIPMVAVSPELHTYILKEIYKYD